MKSVGRKGKQHAKQKAAGGGGGGNDDDDDGGEPGDRPSQLPSIEQRVKLLDRVRVEIVSSVERGQRARLRVRLVHPQRLAQLAAVAPVESIEYENIDV